MSMTPQAAQLLERAQRRRDELSAALGTRRAQLPLRYWRQQAHFTTPAANEPVARKAVESGTGPMGRLLARFEIPAELLLLAESLGSR